MGTCTERLRKNGMVNFLTIKFSLFSLFLLHHKYKPAHSLTFILENSVFKINADPGFIGVKSSTQTSRL